MTLQLTDEEMTALDRLSDRKQMSKAGLIRQALKLYLAIDERLAKGAKIYLEDEEKKEKSEFLVL